ncbi:MAG: biopolymer transporter [Myxococcales bacterium]|nr:biopolymer transporter [Myxococcales bacterium]
MAGVDVGGGGKGKRQLNMEINMIPFIDLLMVTIMFLLITAVWVSYSRINANAQIPGPPDPTKEIDPKAPEKVLNLHILDNEFKLVWKQGATVVSESTIERPRLQGDFKYDDLAAKLTQEWTTHGGHKDQSDKVLDQAILHSDNKLIFKDVIAVIDALYNAQRDMMVDGSLKKVPAFNMSFSVR